jgi:GNAT superfamily N-acetyltransferase
VTETTWNRIVTPESGLWSLMAFDGGEALGIAVVSRTPFAWTGEDILFLQDLFVARKARGRGVGAALLKGVYAHGDSVGASQVFWMVDEDDPELQSFYARHGVRTPYHRYMRRGWPW